MVDVKQFYDSFIDEKVTFFTGVPDSLLKNFCAYLTDNSDNHIISANEGNSIALASGHYLATSNPALVYMQNSGLGNTVNPLLSLADPDVYSIPMILLIGWRGEPGQKDEPQHKKQGLKTTELLSAMDVPYEILNNENISTKELVHNLVQKSINESRPVAIIVKKDTFTPYKLKNDVVTNYDMNREQAIEVLLEYLDEYRIISTTGKTSRELFELREKRKENHFKDFLTVGSMGHSSQIALGIALAKPEHKICCIDGDGAVLMQMGGIPIIGQSKVKNFLHILINNGAHDSVGGQPTVGFSIDFGKIAEASGYDQILTVSCRDDLKTQLDGISVLGGKIFIEIKVNKGARNELGRPTTSPLENKKSFMNSLQK